MKSSFYKYLSLVLVVSVLFSCGESTDKKGKKLDTATSGEITIAVDESYQPVVSAEIDSFHATYPKAKINVVYTSEAKAFELLMKDSVRAIVVPRKLNDEETAWFKKIPLTPRNILLATDGLALIVNNANPDSVLSTEQLEEIFRGKKMSWKEVNPASVLGEVNIVFDQQGSSTERFVREEILNGNKLPANCFAVKGNAEVVDYVEKNKNSIGVIGASYVSDADDPQALSFIKRVNVLSVKPLGEEEDVKPYQAYVATKKYPYIRELYVVSRESRMGLASGFAAYVAGDIGQRIIQKAGLVPATAPIRLVEIK